MGNISFANEHNRANDEAKAYVKERKGDTNLTVSLFMR